MKTSVEGRVQTCSSSPGLKRLAHSTHPSSLAHAMPCLGFRLFRRSLFRHLHAGRTWRQRRFVADLILC
ncbi:hypothetical protein C4K04_6040 [Pseudomonas chlororaphis]|uniref:Uncharacterized protein n=1 Tax=Pseudomonas chlororaphis TaxID=587753 RepID=A0A3G7TZ42_9PSED|nr:hypothetical protein C4K04_6040 [Pseudomonas chlororaphis]